jgi:peptide/nickel transport system permease protein
MSILRPLALRTLTMLGVFFVVMLMLVLTLGLTGYSDRILNAVVGEQLRAERTALAETIRDPDELERVLAECGCRGWCCG